MKVIAQISWLNEQRSWCDAGSSKYIRKNPSAGRTLTAGDLGLSLLLGQKRIPPRNVWGADAARWLKRAWVLQFLMLFGLSSSVVSASAVGVISENRRKIFLRCGSAKGWTQPTWARCGLCHTQITAAGQVWLHWWRKSAGTLGAILRQTSGWM